MNNGGKHGEPWSATDLAQFETMFDQQIGLSEIAAQLGRTERAVQVRMWALQRRRGVSKGKRNQRRLNGASFFLS
jgi:hypothetical protein